MSDINERRQQTGTNKRKYSDNDDDDGGEDGGDGEVNRSTSRAAENDGGDTLLLLHKASEEGDAELCRRLLQLERRQGADVNARDGAGWTPLHTACMFGRVEVAEVLLERKARVNVKEKRRGWTPLHFACSRAEDEEDNDGATLDLVRLLLNHGADVNALDEREEPPLLYACRSNHRNTVDVVRLLLERGAQVHHLAEHDSGFTPLHRAAVHGAELVRLLLQHGANANACCPGEWLPLHLACMKGYQDVILLLLDHGTDVNAVDSYGETPFHTVCYFQDGYEGPRGDVVKLMQLLLDRGADVRASDKRGDTPLHYVFQQSHPDVEIVRLLLDRGANPNVKNILGATPFHELVDNPGADDRQSHQQRVELMLKNGADASLETDEGKTPLCLACQNADAQPEILSILAHEYPAAVYELPLRELKRLVQHFPEALQITNENGNLPIHEACGCRTLRDECIGNVKYMAEQHPASLRHANDMGRLPLHEACYFGAPYDTVVDVLVEAHPDAAFVRDAHGRLPLHLACLGHDEKETFECLLRQRPSTIREEQAHTVVPTKTRDKYGNIPLYYACETNDCPLSAVFLLVQANPESVLLKETSISSGSDS